MAPSQHGTRLALLEAGLALLGELTPADLVAAMRTRAIASRAGVSPASFFHHFASVEDYAEALVAHAFTLPDDVLAGAIDTALTDVQRMATPAERSIRYHANDLVRVAADRASRVRTGLWALGGPSTDAAFARFQAEIRRQLVPQVRAMHEAWGREVRPPLDAESYLALQIALLDGASVLHALDPTVATIPRYARAAAAFSMIMLRAVGDRRTMDDRLAEMNWLPPRAAARRPGDPRSDATRERLLEVAGEHFREYGFDATTVAQLARSAGVHVATLYEHFESKSHLGLVLFDRIAGDRLAHPDPGRVADAGEALEAHLATLGQLVERFPDLAAVYLGALARGDRPASIGDVIRATTRRHVARVYRGTQSTDHEIDATTEQVLVAAIGAMVRHPGDGRWAAARTAVRLVASPTELQVVARGGP